MPVPTATRARAAGRQPGGKRVRFSFPRGVLRRSFFIQITNGALRVNRGPYQSEACFSFGVGAPQNA